MDISDSLHERMDMDEERDDSIEGNIGEEIGIQESTGRETNMYNTDNDGLNTDIGDNDIERRPIDIKEDRRVSGLKLVVAVLKNVGRSLMLATLNTPGAIC